MMKGGRAEDVRIFDILGAGNVGQVALILVFGVVSSRGSMEDPMINEALIEGDMLRSGFWRNAMTVDSRRWKKGVVPFVIDASSASDARAILKGMEDYHTRTCIRFIPRTTESNYVKIFKGEGCYSNVGMVGGEQRLSLGRGCAYQGTVVHELAHALGFYHEHMRSDRDDNLKIFLNNVAPRMHGQFTKLQKWQNKLFNDFDFDSVMLYGSKSFAQDRSKPSMTKKDGSLIKEVYDRKGLSDSDVFRIKKLYNNCNV